MRNRKKEREERERMESMTKTLELEHESLVAWEKALVKERLELREQLYLHAEVCNNGKHEIVDYLNSTTRLL